MRKVYLVLTRPCYRPSYMRTVNIPDLAICAREHFQQLSGIDNHAKLIQELFDARHALLLFIFLEFQIFGLQTKSSQPCLFNWLFRAMSKYK